MSDPKYVQDVTTATLTLAEPRGGSRTLGEKGVYPGTYVADSPSSSGHGVYCCID